MKSKRWVLILVLSPVLCMSATPTLQAKDTQGRATREVESWSNAIARANDDVKALRSRIFVELPKIMEQETQKVHGALDVFRKDRNTASRKKLQQSTVDALLRLVEATEPIVNQRDDLELRLTEIEAKALERAAGYRADAEKFDHALPARESELARHRAESSKLKEQFMAKPNNRELQRALRKRYHEERRKNLDIKSAQLRSRQKVLAAQRLHRKVVELQALHDAVSDVFATLEFVQTHCRDNAKFLLEMVRLEDEISAFGDRAELGELVAKVGDLTRQSDALNAGLDLAIEELLAPDPEGPGGPLELPASGFQRWLDER